MSIFSRRDFLKLSAAGMTAILLNKVKIVSADFSQLPTGDNLGRCFATTKIHARPNIDSEVINTLYEDNVVVINKEVVGTSDSRLLRSKTWYETDAGYIYAPNIQPVKNIENPVLESLPNYGIQPGFWAEVTVPYVDLTLEGNDPKSPKLKELIATNPNPPRFYFSQVLWVDGIQKADDGRILYHVIEKHGSYGDKFWADGRAVKILTPDDLSPIDPEVENKSIVVDVTHQKLSCFEGSREILYTTISTGLCTTIRDNRWMHGQRPLVITLQLIESSFLYTWLAETRIKPQVMRNSLCHIHQFLPQVVLRCIPPIGIMPGVRQCHMDV
jgi:hypothetical protein